MNLLMILVYLLAMVLIGWYGKRKAKSTEDYRVAGRRLGYVFFTGTMSAVVLGGAATIGGVGLGYTYGISGMWMVAAIAVGVMVLSLAFAGRLQRLGVYTVSQMLGLRYGGRAIKASSIVMLGYTVMLAVTSTSAYASIFKVLFDLDRPWGILLGSVVVIGYSIFGGMWSITLTDLLQFLIMTVGMFFLLLPFSLHSAGGWSGLHERLGTEFFDLGSMGADSIITMFVVYTLGLLVGQDIWQRVFTSRTPRVARWGGFAAGVYTLLYGIAGAVIGMAAAVVLPHLETSDEAFAALAQDFLPAGLGGIVLAAGVAAMMSTASGALIASATVARVDVVPLIAQLFRKNDAATFPQDSEDSESISGDRWYVLGIGIIATILAMLVPSVVTALTIAYDILVGGLLVAILGGLFFKRGTGAGAASSMLVGAVSVLVSMVFFGVDANQPIYIGLATSLVVYLVVSLATPRTDAEVFAEWRRRLDGSRT
ncbi:sodium:solute symporter [Kocuria sp. HSID16901]|mgnify:CR=1 FL=1|uniref:sodium:solute symporter n=1 Tax=Kocuria sp. HSID16901 TaxID=2419505 RepID=UPI000660A70C|nr:sodium:solute symporter [Kocuria sp. HSID16901]RUQ21791.1 sodium:solute symporter [Kocuria sp. HSID16901]